MNSPKYPTTSTRIGVREYIEMDVDPRFAPKPQKYRMMFQQPEELSCFKNWETQTYTTTNSHTYQHPQTRGDRSGVQSASARIGGDRFEKALSASRVQYLPPVGLVSQSKRTASRWESTSHGTFKEPVPAPPVAKVESKLCMEPVLVPAGLLLEVGEPIRTTTYLTHFQEPGKEFLAQHLLRCKTTSSMYRPGVTDAAIAKPKNDSTPETFNFVRGPSGDRQILELTDPGTMSPPSKRTIERRPETFNVRPVPSIGKQKSSSHTAHGEPFLEHDRVYRMAVGGPARDPPEYKMENYKRYTIPGFFRVKDGEPMINRELEITMKNRPPETDIPRSKITTVNTLMVHNVPSTYKLRNNKSERLRQKVEQ